ncbi:hypothetical protein TOPH_04648 [Tolypocladium ophioglossoides CBS 100239]|uniref:Uncharacterized protein n=1 Tax=Tolypocladium ophioglossoides (strain CBS 100239) TaxID=1163406 RepID=A0A0L0N9J1_TOLOC|nr:hypothetical protein TOPH_04648 [Tolypocladium ophioglossoides CBS 100239]
MSRSTLKSLRALAPRGDAVERDLQVRALDGELGGLGGLLASTCDGREGIRLQVRRQVIKARDEVYVEGVQSLPLVLCQQHVGLRGIGKLRRPLILEHPNLEQQVRGSLPKAQVRVEAVDEAPAAGLRRPRGGAGGRARGRRLGLEAGGVGGGDARLEGELVNGDGPVVENGGGLVTHVDDPEGAAAQLGLDRVQALQRRLLVKAHDLGEASGLAKDVPGVLGFPRRVDAVGVEVADGDGVGVGALEVRLQVVVEAVARGLEEDVGNGFSLGE